MTIKRIEIHYPPVNDVLSRVFSEIVTRSKFFDWQSDGNVLSRVIQEDEQECFMELAFEITKILPEGKAYAIDNEGRAHQI